MIENANDHVLDDARGVWSPSVYVDDEGHMSLHGRSATELVEQFGSPLYVMDMDAVAQRARYFVDTVKSAFSNTTAHVSYAGKALLSKEIVRVVSEQGLYVDTCSLGEMSIALAAGISGRRIVLHGNNKSDEEIRLAVEHNFDKIVVDSYEEIARVARIATQVGKRARVMVRVTVGVHAGGHEFISTAHEDQKFGIALLPAGIGVHVSDITSAEYADAVAHGPAMAALHEVIRQHDSLELVGIHSHIGSQIHDADAFIQAAQRVLVLRRMCYETCGYVCPEIDLGGGYSVAYMPGEESMDVRDTMERIAAAIKDDSLTYGIPMPSVSFEPGRWIVAPAGLTLYTVGTVKTVGLGDGVERVYVSVDGGMSDNIRPALYGAKYHAQLANRHSDAPEVSARIVGMHCESGDIIVPEIDLPADIHDGDILVVPVTGAYGRTMASNYNQILRPAVVSVSHDDVHVMIRRETVDDLLMLDVSN